MVKTPTGYFPLHVVVGGGSGKQARSQGGLQKVPFMAKKWAKNGVILVGLGLGPYFRKVSSKSFLVQKGPLYLWGPHTLPK